MPSFLLEPEKVIALGTHAFAIGQVKTVMALIAVGWVLVVISLGQALRAVKASLPCRNNGTRWRLFAAWVVAFVLVTGCSRLEILYSQADRLMLMRIDDYKMDTQPTTVRLATEFK